jgi:DNA-binding response OmpR family regulator
VTSRILVVDDSPTILKVVGAILERRGFQAETARDGAAGLAKLEEPEPFDLVLVDFVMPKMNGFQFCRELRRRPKSKSLPVVLMSAKSDRIRQQFVEQTGALDAISKPFDARSLVLVIEGALAKAKAGRTQLALDLETLDDEPSDPTVSRAPDTTNENPLLLLGRRLSGALVAKGLAKDQEATARELEASLGEAPRPLVAAALQSALTGTRQILSGDLAHVSLAEVMQLLQMQKQSGLLVVTTKGRTVSLAFREGLVDLAETEGSRQEFRLGRYFVEAGLVDRRDVEDLAKRAREAGRRIGEELVASGRVSEEARTKALVRQTSEIVYDLVRWQVGAFSFVQHPAPEAATLAKLGLGVPGLIFEGFRRVDEWRLMEGSIVWEDVIVVDDAALAQVEASLTRPERMVVDAVDGKRALSAIVDACELAQFDALKVLFQLKSSRVLRAVPPVGRPSAESRPVDDSTTEHGDSVGG